VHTKLTIGESFHVNILERLEGQVFRMKMFTVCFCTRLSKIWAADAIVYLYKWKLKRENMNIYRVSMNCLIYLIVAVKEF
jgi:hypothetical protein